MEVLWKVILSKRFINYEIKCKSRNISHKGIKLMLSGKSYNN